MCLALPARVIAIDRHGEMATVSLGGIKKDISLILVDDVQVDDFVLIHVGYALNKLNQEEAQRTLQLFAEAGLVEDGAS